MSMKVSMKVKMDHPVYDKGTEIEIPFLGVVENGSSLEVTDEMADGFKAATGKTVNEYFKGNAHVTVDGSTPKKEESK